jgi:NAD(P)H-quinone oxidoreductase subunit 5
MSGHRGGDAVGSASSPRLADRCHRPYPSFSASHAGVVSVGGFLLIRFADVMLSAPFILAILVIVGAYRLLWDRSSC